MISASARSPPGKGGAPNQDEAGASGIESTEPSECRRNPTDAIVATTAVSRTRVASAPRGYIISSPQSQRLSVTPTVQRGPPSRFIVLACFVSPVPCLASPGYAFRTPEGDTRGLYWHAPMRSSRRTSSRDAPCSREEPNPQLSHVDLAIAQDQPRMRTKQPREATPLAQGAERGGEERTFKKLGAVAGAY